MTAFLQKLGTTGLTEHCRNGSTGFVFQFYQVVRRHSCGKVKRVDYSFLFPKVQNCNKNSAHLKQRYVARQLINLWSTAINTGSVFDRVTPDKSMTRTAEHCIAAIGCNAYDRNNVFTISLFYHHSTPLCVI